VQVIDKSSYIMKDSTMSALTTPSRRSATSFDLRELFSVALVNADSLRRSRVQTITCRTTRWPLLIVHISFEERNTGYKEDLIPRREIGGST
jgi:hypothetical protein